MPMKPSPSAETVRPWVPSVRVGSMVMNGYWRRMNASPLFGFIGITS